MNNSYNNSFMSRVRQTVYKWWCVIYKPAYKLFHHGYWPQEKEPYYMSPEANAAMQDTPEENKPDTAENVQSDDARARAEQMAQQIQAGRQQGIDNLVHSGDISESKDDIKPSPEEIDEPEIDLSNMDADALSKANEIMERLAREAAEDEAKKQAEIDAAKKESAEQERLANILKATKPDISMFIEEGKARQNEHREEQTS